jgi:voltage-gated potassium channel
VGSTTYEELRKDRRDIVVIEEDPTSVEVAMGLGALVVEGDATHDVVLEQAGIERASVLISAVRTDSDNLVITLSAKARRPELLVIARVVEAENERKLYMAGADRVVAPQQVGAQRLAALALHPELAEFLELVVGRRTVEFRIAEMRIPTGVPIVGKSLRDLDVRNRVGAVVIAVGTASGDMVLNPDPTEPFVEGQTVIAFGTQQQLDGFRELALGVELGTLTGE